MLTMHYDAAQLHAEGGWMLASDGVTQHHVSSAQMSARLVGEDRVVTGLAVLRIERLPAEVDELCVRTLERSCLIEAFCDA